MRRIIVVICCLIILAGIASCKEENKVPDINQIMKSIPSEYKKQKNINGVMRAFDYDGTVVQERGKDF